MSDIGMHSNVYERVRDFGDLVDDVIVNLRSGRGDDPKRERLAEILISLDSTPPAALSSAWFAMLIGALNPKAGKEWAEVGRALHRSTPDVRTLQQLEALAAKLELRRTEVFAKMSGGG